MLAAAKKDGWSLEYSSEEMRGDSEVVLAAVKKDGWPFEAASKKMRGDRDVVLRAIVQQDGIGGSVVSIVGECNSTGKPWFLAGGLFPRSGHCGPALGMEPEPEPEEPEAEVTRTLLYGDEADRVETAQIAQLVEVVAQLVEVGSVGVPGASQMSLAQKLALASDHADERGRLAASCAASCRAVLQLAVRPSLRLSLVQPTNAAMQMPNRHLRGLGMLAASNQSTRGAFGGSTNRSKSSGTWLPRLPNSSSCMALAPTARTTRRQRSSCSRALRRHIAIRVCCHGDSRGRSKIASRKNSWVENVTENNARATRRSKCRTE